MNNPPPKNEIEKEPQLILDNNVPSIIDNIIPKEENTKKKRKKQKGKLKEIEIKTGFYTLSHQDKNYNPI